MRCADITSSLTIKLQRSRRTATIINSRGGRGRRELLQTLWSSQSTTPIVFNFSLDRINCMQFLAGLFFKSAATNSPRTSQHVRKFAKVPCVHFIGNLCPAAPTPPFQSNHLIPDMFSSRDTFSLGFPFSSTDSSLYWKILGAWNGSGKKFFKSYNLQASTCNIQQGRCQAITAPLVFLTVNAAYCGWAAGHSQFFRLIRGEPGLS
jgi:hypothetical protein